jgi:hypothetical protein
LHEAKKIFHSIFSVKLFLFFAFNRTMGRRKLHSFERSGFLERSTDVLHTMPSKKILSRVLWLAPSFWKSWWIPFLKRTLFFLTQQKEKGAIAFGRSIRRFFVEEAALSSEEEGAAAVAATTAVRQRAEAMAAASATTDIMSTGDGARGGPQPI